MFKVKRRFFKDKVERDVKKKLTYVNSKNLTYVKSMLIIMLNWNCKVEKGNKLNNLYLSVVIRPHWLQNSH